MDHKINIVNKEGNKIDLLLGKKDENLGEILKKHKIFEFPCSGKGICGKCKVKIKEDIEYTQEEAAFIEEKERKQKIHLACKINLNKDITIIHENIETNFTILSKINMENIEVDGLDNLATNNIETYGVGVDIGTTTVVMNLFHLKTGKLIDTYAMVNKQRKWGHDVISRINYGSTKEGLEELNKSITYQIQEMVLTIFNKNNINIDYINHIVIAANTTMLHLLLGEEVEKLGRVPFTPKFLGQINTTAQCLNINKINNCKVTLINGLSTFVGADIVSGIIDTNMDIENKNNLLIDIGTNGEMVLGNSEKLFNCATAAGPAFEAANISCGVGSVEGAICKVYKSGEGLGYETIGGKTPIGICGTGLIDLVAYMLEMEIIDETGYLEEDFIIYEDSKNKVKITPKDIRELQLAKAAVKAGIDTLMYECKINYNDIDKVFVSGGFGNYLNIDSAIKIGLLPQLKDKIIAVGNTALGGACKTLLNNKYLQRANEVNDKSVYIELSTSQMFMDNYIDNMYFE